MHKCACRCGKFVPAERLAEFPNAIYVNPRHKRRAQNRRYRQRVREQLAQITQKSGERSRL